MKKALISVSDKTGVIELAKELSEIGIDIISTGGTASVIKKAGINVTEVSEITGFPECLDGRVKTLHPKVHAGILAVRDNKSHMEKLEELNINTIDLVVINLYPFRKTILQEGVTIEEAIENIDIGGPTMLRAAAKNYKDVAVVVDPADYGIIIEQIKTSRSIEESIRFKLSCKVFEHTAGYDALIWNYLSKQAEINDFPNTLTLTYEKVSQMRYGENPHQKAAFYKESSTWTGSIADAVQLHGKEMSFNNINDTAGALDLLKEFDEASVVVVKHANPCGVASASNIYDAYVNAYRADPVSIFGGIVALNREVDLATAKEINNIFVEIVIAPSYDEDGLEVLKSKKNIRILKLENIGEKYPPETIDMKKVAGGLLVQEYNFADIVKNDANVVTIFKPSREQMDDMIFAMKVVKHTKSNAIVLAKGKQTCGIGPGQPNRVQSVKIAIESAGDKAKGSVLASDAFFPFDDWVEMAYQAGIEAVIQPGGSIRDEVSINGCNKYKIPMVFTGIRHFKH